MAQGRTVRLFLVDGSPTGLITAEVMNWTGHVLYAPRSKLAEALKRGEAERTGVYLLIGDDPENPTHSKLYIGEGDTVRKRVKNHAEDDSKDFWTHACMITSTDKNLTKSHVRYLEGRLIALASEASRATLANGTNPDTTNLLPESDTSDMEYFISQIMVILPVLGIDLLRPKPHWIDPNSKKIQTEEITQTDTLELELIAKKHDYSAKAIEQNGELTVLKRSTTWMNPTHAFNNYSGLREQLIQNGVLKEESAKPGFYIFQEDYTFSSPSAAASVINGRNSNGRTDWVLAKSGKTLKEHQNEQLFSVNVE